MFGFSAGCSRGPKDGPSVPTSQPTKIEQPKTEVPAPPTYRILDAQADKELDKQFASSAGRDAAKKKYAGQRWRLWAKAGAFNNLLLVVKPPEFEYVTIKLRSEKEKEKITLNQSYWFEAEVTEFGLVTGREMIEGIVVDMPAPAGKPGS